MSGAGIFLHQTIQTSLLINIKKIIYYEEILRNGRNGFVWCNSYC